MVKTLRITTVIAAVLAVFFLLFLAVFGVRSDEDAEEFLNSASVIEKFAKARGARSKDSSSQTPPLVKQAQAFGLYLNPPAQAPTKPKMPVSTRRTGVRPSQVSAKFELVGTSFHASHPELSLALIDQPGKGLCWVRQSSRVGHLLIDQIKDGLVVIKDGERTFELAPARPERISLVKKKPDEAADANANSVPQVSSRITTGKLPPPLTDEKQEMLKKLMSRMMAVDADSGSDKTGSGRSDEEKTEMMKELLSQFQDTRISSKEAQKLDRLGKQLKRDVRPDPNQSRPGGIRRPPPTRRRQQPKK